MINAHGRNEQDLQALLAPSEVEREKRQELLETLKATREALEAINALVASS